MTVLIPMAQIVPSVHNPRVVRPNDPTIAELAASIKARGLLQNVVVRPINGGYELLAGRRRFEAHKLNKATEILASVQQLDDAAAIEVTVLENLQREDLTPMEEARGVASLLKSGKDHKAIAERMGKSLAWVYRRAQLVHLLPAFVDAFEDPKSDWSRLSTAHLERIARLPSSMQAGLLKQSWLATRSLAEFDSYLTRGLMFMRSAPWDLDDPGLVALPSKSPIAPCAECKKRSSVSPELWHDKPEASEIEKKDRCLDPDCWKRKLHSHIERRREELANESKGSVALVHGDGGRHESDYKAALDTWDYKRVKKSTPGAKLALVVDGDGAGKECWITQDKRSSGLSAGRAPRMPSIELRRKALVVKAVIDILKKQKCPLGDDVLNIVPLVLAFGTSSHTGYAKKETWTDYWKMTAEDMKALASRLWYEIRPVLLQRLRLYTAEACDPQFEEAVQVVKLLNLKLEVLEADALAALPGKPKQSKESKPTKSAKKGGKK